MSLKSEILGSCNICKGSGYLPDSSVCSCLLKFRSYNRLINAGFFRSTLDLFSGDKYVLPIMESGESFIKYFVKNPSYVEEKGLSLYIWSRDRGRGKTTLEHYLMYNALSLFSNIDLYASSRTYCFHHISTFYEIFRKGLSNEDWKSTWYVLDDLGNEDRAGDLDWKKEVMVSSLQRVLHYRRDKKLPTIISSNYSPSDLSILYSGELDSLLEIKFDGNLGGLLFREVHVDGEEDLRLMEEESAWGIVSEEEKDGNNIS